ncbi:MAG: AI-2E family transporter [Firmicutes bacterium]|nr:AI-2E family transporter [Bacillota bacterium]
MSGILLALLVYFSYLLRNIFLSLILAVVLAYLLHPLVQAVEKRGVSRTASIVIVYTATFFIAAGLLLYGMPHIISQLYKVADAIPGYAAQVQSFTASLQTEYARAGIPEALRHIIDERISWLEAMIIWQAERVVEILLGLAGYIFNIILAPIFAFYLLKDNELFTSRLVSFIPPGSREDVLTLGGEISRVIDSFVRGYLLVSLVTGFLTGLAMTLLNMEFALMLGIFAGLTNLIPYFGPLIGAIPAVALALLVSKWMVLKVIIAYVIIQQIESTVIGPRIIGNRVGLHPLFVILVLLAGAQLYGLTGLILAVPVAAILRVLFRFVFFKYLPGND